MVLDQLRKNRKGRFLSSTWLNKKLDRFRLSPEEHNRILKAFDTVEDVQKATVSQIQSLAGLDLKTAQIIEMSLK